ncbi:hypothetical protein GCM10028778_02050 [Barrientosiimonas marina]|uniref:YkyB family protein n=1 Tax=Lentibacillus kimchii TaxID=1542911 RepID=A0ABW2USX7_9BACI
MNEYESIPLDELAQALFTINRHAKTAPEPKHLYTIKKESIKRLLKESRAEKIGLHFSDHPKFSNQNSTLLVKVDKYFFHIPPAKDDFRQLDHLGKLDQNYRNPPTRMSLSQAKRIVYRHIDWQPPKKQKSQPYKRSSHFTPSSLGQAERSPKKSFHRSR